MRCNTIQHNTTQRKIIQCNILQCNTMQRYTIQCNTMQCNTLQSNIMQRNAMRCKNNIIQYNTIQIKCNNHYRNCQIFKALLKSQGTSLFTFINTTYIFLCIHAYMHACTLSKYVTGGISPEKDYQGRSPAGKPL